jgi:hypothetical protein
VSGFAEPRGGRLLATALARVEEWLLDPAERADGASAQPAPPASDPPIVAVVPLAARCGSTTVARALAATLAARSTLGAAIVAGPSGSVALSLSTPGATRLGRSVGDWIDAPHRVSGRLCLVDADARMARAAALRSQCALVIDVPHGADASEPAALADAIVLVAGADTEPALAAVVGAALAGAGPEPLVVVSRPDAESVWLGRADFELLDARLSSRIALAGREPPGVLGAAIAALAERCAEAVR